MREIRCVVIGRVQGVSYRYFAQRHARLLGLAGYAKNLPDGSVEIVAQGEREALERFITALRRGSFFSRVDGVQAQWREPRERFAGFHIAC